MSDSDLRYIREQIVVLIFYGGKVFITRGLSLTSTCYVLHTVFGVVSCQC